jgi:hypothetical protein
LQSKPAVLTDLFASVASPVTALQRQDHQPEVEAGPVLQAVLKAKAATIEATKGGAIRETVDALVAQGRSMGARRLFGASEIGHALAGAMAYAAPEMEIWTPGSPIEHVLLIDGALASQAGARWHMEIALAAGSERVDALVLSAPDPPPGAVGGEEKGRVVELFGLQVAA